MVIQARMSPTNIRCVGFSQKKSAAMFYLEILPWSNGGKEMLNDGAEKGSHFLEPNPQPVSALGVAPVSFIM